MIPKYLATLTVSVVLVTLAASSLQFATRAQVRGGKAEDENVRLEFTIDADSDHTYPVNPAMAEFLRSHITFQAASPARVKTTAIEIKPKKVSWTENHKTITASGAAMNAQLTWDSAPDSANGAHGYIYFAFPEIPGHPGATPSFHSGGYQKDDSGHYVIREVTTYQNAFQLSFARFLFALAAGLPFGILLHTICWAFVLAREKRSLVSALPPRTNGSLQTFYPDPTAEWTVGLLVLGIGAFGTSLMAAFSVADAFMSSSLASIGYIIIAIAAAIGILVAYFTRRGVLTVRVGPDGMSWARGRGNLQWLNAAWGDIRAITEKARTNRGVTTRWIEVEFWDDRKMLKVTKTLEGYAAFRDVLSSAFVVR